MGPNRALHPPLFKGQHLQFVLGSLTVMTHLADELPFIGEELAPAVEPINLDQHGRREGRAG
jgi:hypothetical protein